MKLYTVVDAVGGGSLPAVPTRAQALAYHTHFMGGIVVNSPTYGLMPWWDSALSWCDPTTRQLAYAAKHAAGDTHAILEVPNGKPLYNEGGQFYSPDKFGPLDWTRGETQLTADFDRLLDEILDNGFYFHIAMDETQQDSMNISKLVARRLKDLGLSAYGFMMPGYDGVFYGWEPSNEVIPLWAADARAINPDILLGIEHQPGKIPLGNGADDYRTNGLMTGFDVILGEFDMPPDDTVWQVLGRMVRPYHRPANQPSGDDPNPPFYLQDDSPRGPYVYVGFETDNPYHWVRTNMSDLVAVQAAVASAEADRAYLKQCGAVYTG
jgi:hypothetical protein